MRGVYLDGDAAASLADRVRAALLVAPRGAVATGVTTFALAGIAMPDLFKEEADKRVHLLVPPGAARPRRPEVVIHSRAAHCRGLVHKLTGLGTASIAHSWVDAVRRIGLDHSWRWPSDEPPFLRGRFDSPTKRLLLEAVRFGDGLMRRDKARVQREALIQCSQAAGKSPGLALVRTAVQLTRARTDSFMETWLRLVVWDAGFPEPTVNYMVRVDGRRRFLDLAWPEKRIALEYHGRQHFEDSPQAYDDMVRRGLLQDAGWILIEAAHGDIADPSGLLRRLAKVFNR
jgi:very-short-patch-repair endonuclease